MAVAAAAAVGVVRTADAGPKGFEATAPLDTTLPV
jgi:hypothetical protein